MRILYASERPPYPFFLGGAARCAHQLLHNLNGELGNNCAAVGSADYSITPWRFPDPSEYPVLGIKSRTSNAGLEVLDCGYPVNVIPDFSSRLGSFIDDFAPDVIWSQLEGAREILTIARKRGIQGLLYVHDAEFDIAEIESAAAFGAHLVCSSRFLAEKVRKRTGNTAHVVYPATELYFGTVGDSNGYVTMVNPHRVKGVETLLAVAQELPSERFLLLESWKLGESELARLLSQLDDLPNVEFVRRVSDMSAIYAKTRLLLVPSVWEEGFGMVAIEAQSCGIPVIASARGGLPESVGAGGILIKDYLNPAEWVTAIRQVLHAPESYAEWSARALQHARSEQFLPQALARDFLAACKGARPRQSRAARAISSMRDHALKVPVLGRLLRRD